MGLFDFFRRKRHAAEPALPAFDALPEARCHHYTLAHVALRGVALRDPLLYVGVLASPDADRFLSDLFRSVADHCLAREPEPGFTAADLTVHRLRVGVFPCAVVELPPPRAMAEAHFTAAVLLADPAAGLPKDGPVPVRYFTLEMGFSLDGSNRTVLCEWTADGTHANFGDGPEATVPAFVAALERLVAR
jgi:hypothetical protein